MIRSRLGLSAAGEPVLVLLLVIAVVVFVAQSSMRERFSGLVVLGGNATAAGEDVPSGYSERDQASVWLNHLARHLDLDKPLHVPVTSLADDLPGGLSAHITDQARNSSGLFVIWPSAPVHPRSLQTVDSRRSASVAMTQQLRQRIRTLVDQGANHVLVANMSIEHALELTSDEDGRASHSERVLERNDRFRRMLAVMEHRHGTRLYFLDVYGYMLRFGLKTALKESLVEAVHGNGDRAPALRKVWNPEFDGRIERRLHRGLATLAAQQTNRAPAIVLLCMIVGIGLLLYRVLSRAERFAAGQFLMSCRTGH